MRTTFNVHTIVIKLFMRLEKAGTQTDISTEKVTLALQVSKYKHLEICISLRDMKHRVCPIPGPNIRVQQQGIAQYSAEVDTSESGVQLCSQPGGEVTRHASDGEQCS